LAPLVLIAWVAVVASSLIGGPPVFDRMSMDDFMRLAEARDLLGGQGWFDLTQYRLDPPTGVAMHWSRIVDLPIAAIVFVLSPILGRAGAELAMATLWPQLLLLPALALTAVIARRLAGETAALAAVLLAAVSAPSLVHFRPGGLDHHGVQLMLLLVTIAGAMAPGHKRLMPAVAGFAAAVSIAVGIEMTPALAAILAVVGLRWAIEGEAAARMVSNFGLAFGAGTAALFAATVPPSAWNAPVCDQLSVAWLAAAGLAGGGLALLSAASARLPSVRARLLAGGAAGLAAIGLVALAFPHCLRDPYADLDPRMVALWLDHVAETQSVFDIVKNSPAEALPIYLPPLAALVLGGLAAWRAQPDERMAFLAPMVTLFTLVVVALWQVRGAAGANLLAQALLAAALVRLIGANDGARARVRLLLLVAALAVSSPVLVIAGQGVNAVLTAIDPGRPVLFYDGPGACRRPADVAPLKRLSPGTVVSFVDLGPAILAETPHSILAAPYHRNGAGNTAAFDLLLGDDATARRVIEQRRIDYVAICPGSPERINFERAAPDGLMARLARGEMPHYLEAAAGDPAEPLRVFRVRR
jgi:hypothetical protein